MTEKIIRAIVHPGSSQKKALEKEGELHLYIHAKPQKGEANKQAIEILADYLKVPKSSVVLTGGEKSKSKKFKIKS